MSAPAVEPLYVRDGSRFVLYDPARQHTPPIPEPRRVYAEGEPTAESPVVEVTPGFYRVYAPRCPHGYFARWAARNCRRCGSAR